MAQELKNTFVNLDRIKREHSHVCERLSACTRRLASSSADVNLLRKECEELAKKEKERDQSIERLEHDSEMQKNLISELKAELLATRSMEEKRENGMIKDIPGNLNMNAL
jgi:chromosome segregation ATPase